MPSTKPKTAKTIMASNPCEVPFGELTAAGIYLDLAYQSITSPEWQELFKRADKSNLQKKIEGLFTGAIVNPSEARPALHTALRNLNKTPVLVNDEDIMPAIAEVWQRIDNLCNKWIGVTDLIHIGIGGSDFGPRLAMHALAHSNAKSQRNLMRIHFAANVDSAELEQILSRAQPNSTKVLIVSKSFTTSETIHNARAILHWFKENNLTNSQIQNALFAVTANVDGAKAFGVDEENIYPFWDWVGGRFSVWSAVGLPIALQYGFDTFKAFLQGADAMDQHFRNTSFEKNLPVLMALAMVHQQEKHQGKAFAIIPYAHSLELLPFWLQQLEMESHGKSIGLNGKAGLGSSPIVFGSAGSNAQHSFFQLLHQGPDVIPVDFVAVISAMSSLPQAETQHRVLLANCLAQAQALALGKNTDDPNQTYLGQRPSNLILLKQLDAFHLGALLSLYEHRAVCLGHLWNLNSFDQPGVELGKVLARPIEAALNETDKASDTSSFDTITAARIDFLKKPK